MRNRRANSTLNAGTPAAQLDELARQVGDFWQHADAYYDGAEAEMDNRWEHLLTPYLVGFDFSICVDLAAGHGRNTRKLLEQADCRRVYCVDINDQNIEFCRRRFAGGGRVIIVKTDGHSLPEIKDGEVTCFYCFDAMVHFDSDVVRAYLREIRRTLSPLGKAFLHH